MTGDLLAWLNAQLDEDERLARQAASANPGSAAEHWSAEKADLRSPVDCAWRPTWAIVPKRVKGITLAVCPADITPRVVSHIARHDPARVLREVAAKRAIVDRYEQTLLFQKVLDADFEDWNTEYDRRGNNTADLDGRLVVMQQERYALYAIRPVLRAVVEALAWIYADRPGFDPQWTPSITRTSEQHAPGNTRQE